VRGSKVSAHLVLNRRSGEAEPSTASSTARAAAARTASGAARPAGAASATRAAKRKTTRRSPVSSAGGGEGDGDADADAAASAANPAAIGLLVGRHRVTLTRRAGSLGFSRSGLSLVRCGWQWCWRVGWARSKLVTN
jgi:hypothetical protein